MVVDLQQARHHNAQGWGTSVIESGELTVIATTQRSQLSVATSGTMQRGQMTQPSSVTMRSSSGLAQKSQSATVIPPHGLNGGRVLSGVPSGHRWGSHRQAPSPDGGHACTPSFGGERSRPLMSTLGPHDGGIKDSSRPRVASVPTACRRSMMLR